MKKDKVYRSYTGVTIQSIIDRCLFMSFEGFEILSINIRKLENEYKGLVVYQEVPKEAPY